MRAAPDRLVHTGNVLIDLVMTVPALPARGGDVLASSASELPGGAFNVMAAAARLGLPTAYAGAHGTGPRGDRIRAALAAEGIEVLLPREPALDTGFDVCLVDEGGERSFVTSPGAEARLRAEQLAAVAVRPGDVVQISGYSLVHAANRAALVRWLPTVPADVPVGFDPGPLAASIPAGTRAAVCGRARWLTCNLAEARALSGLGDPVAAADRLCGAARTVIVRMGAAGALVAAPGAAPVRVPAVPVAAVDSTGAGDAHTGAMLAALARGADVVEAVRVANAAAAFAVTRRGPATGPTRAELARFRGEDPPAG